MRVFAMSVACLVVCASSGLAQCNLQWVGGGSLGGPVNDFNVRPTGELIACGGYWGGSHVREWNGNSWINFGWAPTSNGLAALDNGDVLVIGQFSYTTNPPYFPPTTTYHAGFYVTPTGSTPYLLSPFGSSGVSGYSVETLTDGSVVASWGSYSFTFVSQFSSSSPGWPFGLPGGQALAASPAGGYVSIDYQSNLVHWDGATTILGSANFNSSPTKMRVLANGDIVVAGPFTQLGATPMAGVARWDGAAWTSLAADNDGFLNDIAELPNGDLVVAGCFTIIGGQPADNIARWDGAAWSPIDSGTDGEVRALQWMPDGTLWVGGDFSQAGGSPHANIVRLAPTCPASATSLGGGCTGSAGPDELVAETLPWKGGAYRSRASGLPTIAIAIGVYGFGSVNTPLSLISPLAAPGCDLLVMPDVLQPGIVLNGTFEDTILLGDPSVFGGQQLYHQVVAIGLDAGGNILEWSSSNALELTVGEF